MAPTVRDILRRFRPAVAPGPAAPAGVPADWVAEAETELAAVFTALAPTQADARRVVAEARADAARAAEAAAEEANGILDAARTRLEAVRLEAASAHLAALDSERAAVDAAARAEAGRIRDVAARRLPELVDEVLDEVWGIAGLAAGTRATRARRRTG